MRVVWVVGGTRIIRVIRVSRDTSSDGIIRDIGIRVIRRMESREELSLQEVVRLLERYWCYEC